jgi:hypothetical protein
MNIIEFIFYGIKFTLKLSNVKYANIINLSELNNYEAYVIIDKNIKQNEIYISKRENFILLIVKSFDTNNYNSNNIVEVNLQSNKIEVPNYGVSENTY